ncbi:MAG: hypothetical protein JEZ14_14990 [Marinilabiliaceae bacterium]|nr:hypothetical protein [Marinilabiliaceae bacterium]
MSLTSVMQEAIEKAASAIIPVLVTEGTVIKVDKTAGTCDIERDGLPELFKVRLNAVTTPGDQVMTIYPKKGSKCLVVLVENNPTDGYLLSATDIDEIIINGGKNGGLTITPTLVSNLDKLTARVDGIMDALQNAVVGSADGGATFKTNIIAALELITEKEDFSGIENSKVKH